MDEYLKANRDLWDELTPIHARSAFYDVEGFKKGWSTFESIELEELGSVAGKSLLHLQCHFGMDTLSWARLGAEVTGVDFSDEAIKLARSLSRELVINADFICSDIYELPEALSKKFDIVFTGRGVLCWLPDLEKWAQIIRHFLKPGGIFYIVEGHPFTTVFDNSMGAMELRAMYSYFHRVEPTRWEPEGDYAEKDAVVTRPSYEWTHTLGDIINALIGAGLRIDSLHEFPYTFYKHFPFMEEFKPKHWRIKGVDIPLSFSMSATKV